MLPPANNHKYEHENTMIIILIQDMLFENLVKLYNTHILNDRTSEVVIVMNEKFSKKEIVQILPKLVEICSILVSWNYGIIVWTWNIWSNQVVTYAENDFSSRVNMYKSVFHVNLENAQGGDLCVPVIFNPPLAINTSVQVNGVLTNSIAGTEIWLTTLLADAINASVRYVVIKFFEGGTVKDLEEPTIKYATEYLQKPYKMYVGKNLIIADVLPADIAMR